jgi:hypothetical protein
VDKTKIINLKTFIMNANQKAKLAELQNRIDLLETLNDQEMTLYNSLKAMDIPTQTIIPTLSVSTFEVLKSREVKPLASLKSKLIVGVSGKITSLKIKELSGESWAKERTKIQKTYPQYDMSSLDSETVNTSGTVIIQQADKSTLSFYVNNDLMSMLIKAKAVEIDTDGALTITDKVINFGVNEVTFVN